MGNCLMPSDPKHSGNVKLVENSDERVEKGGGRVVQSSEGSSNSSVGCLREFTLQELKIATSDYSSCNLLGEGGFGQVYKGMMEGFVVAVKRLNAGGRQGHREWLTEVESLGKLHHPNLVQLIGLAVEDDQRLLVYEYMPMGSLEDLLSDEHCTELNWERRLKIVTDIAKGLTYLHSQSPPVIHRDLKPSNILLDMKYNAKLCDFGLARDGPTEELTHVSTRVMGTHAYVDPDYFNTGRLRVGSDVYGFGVVLLQILTGRKALVTTDAGHSSGIADWARPWLRDKKRLKIQEIVDPRLQEYPVEGAFLMGYLADCCTGELKIRPKAERIERFLKRIADIDSFSRHP